GGGKKEKQNKTPTHEKPEAPRAQLFVYLNKENKLTKNAHEQKTEPKNIKANAREFLILWQKKPQSPHPLQKKRQEIQAKK
ncbi:hypothetical protein ACQWFX_25620, partial [Salmonella enterica subsp. enterica serovar Infantis]